MTKDYLDKVVQVLEKVLEAQLELEEKHNNVFNLEMFDSLIAGFISGFSIDKELFTDKEVDYINRSIEKLPIAKKVNFGQLVEEVIVDEIV